MSEKKPPITTYQIFLEACRIYAKTSTPVAKLAFFALFLPYLAVYLGLSHLSGKYAQATLLDPALAATQGVEPLADMAVQFFSVFVSAALILLFFFVPALVAMVRIAIEYYCEQRVLSVKEAINSKHMISSYTLLLCLSLLSLLEQGIFGPFPVITMFAAMSFVIMLVERRGAMSSLSHALFFRYTSPNTSGAFGPFLILTTVAIFIYGAESTLSYLQVFILRGDEIIGIPRSIWAARCLFFPFTYVYMITLILDMLFRVLMVSFLPSFCVCLYYVVRPKFSQRI